MLKLIHDLDMEFSNVKNYYDSFEDKEQDLNCYAICQINQGPQVYFDWISTYKKNMYYLVDDENPSYIIGYGAFNDFKVLNYHLEHLNKGAVS